MLGTLKVNATKIALFDNLPLSAFDNTLRLFHQVDRPLLLGEVSLEIGWSLERTEQIIHDLIAQGEIRRATREERRNYDLHPEAALFSLVKRRKLSLAHR